MRKHVLMALVVIAILAVGGVLIAFAEPGVEHEPAPAPSYSPGTPHTHPSPSIAPEQGTWRKLKEFDGKSTRTTLPFTVEKGAKEHKVTVIIKGNPAWASIFAAFIVPFNQKNVDPSHVIGPFTNGQHRGLPIYLVPDKYRLSVQSANCSWHVTIWELR